MDREMKMLIYGIFLGFGLFQVITFGGLFLLPDSFKGASPLIALAVIVIPSLVLFKHYDRLANLEEG